MTTTTYTIDQLVESALRQLHPQADKLDDSDTRLTKNSSPLECRPLRMVFSHRKLTKRLGVSPHSSIPIDSSYETTLTSIPIEWQYVHVYSLFR